MAKIAFIQKSWFDIHGPMYISALLKKNGHQTQLLVEPAERDLAAALKQFNPDVIAFSLVTDEYQWAADLANSLRAELAVPIVFGGIHPTFCPEECLANSGVDIVCRGEGEHAILELLDSIVTRDAARTSIRNLWIKKNQEIIKNPVRPLIEDLDALPMPDREIYYARYKSLGDYPIKKFMSGRGCPYECSYCCNKGLKRLYRGQGRYLRKRSPENLIAEIQAVRSRWPLKMIEFIDDEFAHEQKWLEKFAEQYRNEINLPFTCLVRIDLVNEKKIQLLKHAGCVTVNFGVESGNDRIRREILHRSISDETIIQGAALLKKYRLKFYAYNMLNIPTETIKEGLETVRINARIQADYPWCSLFQPYPGTEMWDRFIVAAQNTGGSRPAHSFYESSFIEQPDADKLKNLQKFFYIAVRMPWTLGIIKLLISLKPKSIYNYIFLATFGYRQMRANRLSLFDTIRFNFKHVGTYFKRR